MDWLSGIIGGLGGLLSAIENILIWLFNLIVQVAQFIWQALQFIADVFVQVFKNVARFFQHLWDGFFKKIFTGLLKAVVKAHDFLEKHLRPVINFLKKIQKIVQQYYKTYIRPILNALNHVRQVLQILKALHVKWAADLDAKIRQIEGKIQGAFLAVNGVLNAAIDLLNLVADPTKLLRRPMLLLSFRRVFHSLVRSLTGLPPAFFFPSPRKNAPRGLGFLPANFDPSNPDHNPPASYYLGLDYGVPSLDFLAPDELVPDSIVDDMALLDFYNTELWAASDCLDPTQCMMEAVAAAGQWESASG